VAPVLAFDRPAFGLTERKALKDRFAPVNGNVGKTRLDLNINSSSPVSQEDVNYYTYDFAADLTIAMVQLVTKQAISSSSTTTTLPRIILIGHSMGSAVSLFTYYKYPELISGLLLESPAIYSSPPDIVASLSKAFSSLSTWFVGLMFKSFGDMFITKAFHDRKKLTAVPQAQQIAAKTIAVFQLPLFEQTLVTLMYNMIIHPHTVHEQLNSIDGSKVVVQIVASEHDTFVKMDETKKAQANIKNAKPLIIVRNCGHAAHEELPEEYLKIQVEFVKEILQKEKPQQQLQEQPSAQESITTAQNRESTSINDIAVAVDS